jgi:hypothetical protein
MKWYTLDKDKLIKCKCVKIYKRWYNKEEESKMLIQDLFGFIRRNSKNLNTSQVKKMLIEINQIKTYLERILKDKGVA